MAAPKPRVKIPSRVRKGQVFAVRTLIKHQMESGQRKDRATGKLVPRNIINKFVAKFNGEEVFSLDLEPAMAADPYLTFKMKAETSGEFEFAWVEDSGNKIVARKKLVVG